MALKDFMGRAEKPEEARGEAVPQASVGLRRPVTPSTCIDASSELSGKLRCQGTLRIEGRVDGEVYCEQTLMVGESAKVQAVIQADTVIISGEVEGDIAAKRKITLEKNARVTGDLCTPGIVIEEGAKLEGRIVIGSDEQPAPAKQPAAGSAARPREPAPQQPPAPSTGPPSSGP